MTHPLHGESVLRVPEGPGLRRDVDPDDAALAPVELGRGRRVPTVPPEALQENADVIGLLSDTATPATVADVECGTGLAGINLALAYPHITVVGFSSNPDDLPVAQANAQAAGVDERVSFELLGGRRVLLPAQRFDLVFFFGSAQTMAAPRLALDEARAGLTDRGLVVMISPGAAEEPQSDDPVVEDQGRGTRDMELDPAEQVQVFFPDARVLWCPPPGQLEPGLGDQRGGIRKPEETRAWLRRRVEVAGDGLGSIGTREGPDL